MNKIVDKIELEDGKLVIEDFEYEVTNVNYNIKSGEAIVTCIIKSEKVAFNGKEYSLPSGGYEHTVTVLNADSNVVILLNNFKL